MLKVDTTFQLLQGTHFDVYRKSVMIVEVKYFLTLETENDRSSNILIVSSISKSPRFGKYHLLLRITTNSTIKNVLFAMFLKFNLLEG